MSSKSIYAVNTSFSFVSMCLTVLICSLINLSIKICCNQNFVLTFNFNNTTKPLVFVFYSANLKYLKTRNFFGVENNLFWIFFDVKLLCLCAESFSTNILNTWSKYLGSSLCINHDFEMSSQLWSILPTLILLSKSIKSMSSFWGMIWSNSANLGLSQRSTLTNASGVLVLSHFKRELA